MSSTDSGTAAQPSGRHTPIRMLLRAGKNDEAIVQLCSIVVARPDDVEAKELLFDAFFHAIGRRRWCLSTSWSAAGRMISACGDP